MKKLALIAVMTIASAAAMAQAPAGTLTRPAAETAPMNSGGKAADKGQAKADAKGATAMGTTTMGAGMNGKAMRWSDMDANKDGMVSQEEYMTYHTGRWSKMKQTNGMVSMSDMEASMNDTGGKAGGPN